MLRVGVVGLVLVACSVTTSHTGAFVHDVRFVDGKMLVVACDVAVTVSDSIDLTTSRNESETAKVNGCESKSLRMPTDSALVGGAPEECDESVERWYVASTAQPAWSAAGRMKLWRAIPRACRAYLEERTR